MAMQVVPLAGTWIEMDYLDILCFAICVVPLAGTWIEIQLVKFIIFWTYSRSPCGDVD